MPTALSLSRCVSVVADYEARGYRHVRDTEVGVVLRHPNGGVMTVLANGESRGGDQAGPSATTATAWWSEPTYTSPE
jgi:hypothetical protein